MAQAHGRLAGRIAPITGGRRGIGAAIARAFAAESAAVALVHLGDHANAKTLVAESEARTLSPNGDDVML